MLRDRSPGSTNPHTTHVGNANKSLTTRRSVTPGRSTGLSDINLPNGAQSLPNSKITLPKFHHERIIGTKCTVCKRKFATNALLRKHYGIHDGYDRYV